MPAAEMDTSGSVSLRKFLSIAQSSSVINESAKIRRALLLRSRPEGLSKSSEGSDGLQIISISAGFAISPIDFNAFSAALRETSSIKAAINNGTVSGRRNEPSASITPDNVRVFAIRKRTSNTSSVCHLARERAAVFSTASSPKRKTGSEISFGVLRYSIRASFAPSRARAVTAL